MNIFKTYWRDSVDDNCTVCWLNDDPLLDVIDFFNVKVEVFSD